MSKETVVYDAYRVKPECKPEKMAHNRKVSMSGYLPPEERIKTMVAAGQRLYDARKAFYDAERGIDTPVDPTIAKDYDFAQAHADMERVKENLEKTKAARAELLKKAKETAEKTVKGEKKASEKADGAI